MAAPVHTHTHYTETFTRNRIPIWIGKNARSNDILTFELAHPKDLWFHITGSSGSRAAGSSGPRAAGSSGSRVAGSSGPHVVLHTEGIFIPTAADIQEASDHARRRPPHPYPHPPNARVTCVPIDHLTKSKYDKHGQVRIQAPKIFRANPPSP